MSKAQPHGAALILAAALALVPHPPAMAAPSVLGPQGTLTGLDTPDGGATFLGVPYAAPPEGDLRWRAPQPPAAWSGARAASKNPPSCPQSDYGAWNADDAARGREDCLYLNIHTPQLDPAARLPVMVWIHGGGNRGGSMRGIVASSLAGKGVVLVAIQYRLAALGFMAHPALAAETPGHTAGDYGLMDQIAALRWVHANIARFGGDPDNITIFGQSAGAQDVGLLNLAPAARGLYAKAIEESGTADFGMHPLTPAKAQALGVLIAGKAGAPPNATAAQLRALPLAALLAAPEQGPLPGFNDASYVWLGPVVDGDVLPRSPEAVLGAAAQAPIPLIIGVNAHELDMAWTNPASEVREIYGPKAAGALAFYGLAPGAAPLAADPLLGDVKAQIATDYGFRCPAVHVAASQARAGAPVWLYHYERTPASGPLGHSSELASVFGGWPISPPGAAPAYALADYWAAFAKTGQPNAPGLPVWRRQTTDQHPYMAFTDQGPQAREALRSLPCQLSDRF